MRSRFLATALGVVVAATAAATPQRFPRPEFDTDYVTPVPTVPAPSPGLMEALDVALLGAALAAAVYLALRARSRVGLQALGIGSLLYFGFYRSGCICPVGSVQNVAAVLGDRAFVLPATVVALFLLPLLAALLAGRVFCSGVCPFGALQDLLLLRPMRVPEPVAGALGLGRHLVLAGGVLLAAVGARFLVCEIDPYVPVFRLGGSLPRLLWAGAFVALATVIARPYCRFLCPYGLLLGWVSRLAVHPVRTCPAGCVDCRLCGDACPVGAILPPTGTALPEPRAAAVRRLATLLALLPLLVGAGGWATSRLDLVLARLHPTVALAERVALEEAGLVEGATVDSRAFRFRGGSLQELEDRAEEIRGRFRFGGLLAGSFLAVAVGGRLVRLALWRPRREPATDPGACVACGRCFAACPRERVRRHGLPAEVRHG